MDGQGNAEPRPTRVEEFQGLYGPYHVPERLLQKIWLRGELDLARLRTTAGRPIRILRVGEWNLLGGPDFKDADLEIEGRQFTGDVEIHFRQEDWYAHRHQLDSAYDRVVLHLVLFPPRPGSRPVRTSKGREIETATLVDLLWHDLEEYVINEAAAQVSTTTRDRALETLLLLSPEKRREQLIELATHRWTQKVHFARIHTERLGWAQACHTTVMEVLGYSRNRPGMLAAADRFPLEVWSAPEFDPVVVMDRDDIPWQRQGVRPANQPRRRLLQYATMCAVGPDWTERLTSWAVSLPRGNGGRAIESVGERRRKLGVAGYRRTLQAGVIRGALTGPRAETVAVDALFPMLAARNHTGLFDLWFVWPPGDVPTDFKSVLRQTGVAGTERAHPFAHGWFQGLLGLSLQIPADT